MGWHRDQFKRLYLHRNSQRATMGFALVVNLFNLFVTDWPWGRWMSVACICFILATQVWIEQRYRRR